MITMWLQERGRVKSVMLLVFLAMSGCAYVTSPVIVGETPVDIASERNAWEGIWLMGGKLPVTVKVLDGSNGVLQVGWIQDDADGNMSMETVHAHLREGGGWMFVTLSSPDGMEKDEPLMWARIKRDDDLCILWLPCVTKFRPLVEQGILPGQIPVSEDGTRQGRGVDLGELKAEHLGQIISGEHGLLFDWEEPMIFIKGI